MVVVKSTAGNTETGFVSRQAVARAEEHMARAAPTANDVSLPCVCIFNVAVRSGST